ncbi:helix-turn-helix domain-containing protein [Azospirillum melinis]
MGTPSLSVTIRKVAGIEDLQDCVQGTSLRTKQLSPGQCHGAVLHAGVAGLPVSAGTFKGDVRVRGVMAPAMVTLGTVLDTNGFVGQWGIEAAVGDIFVFPCDSEQEGRFWGAASYTTISLPLDRLLSMAAPFDHLADAALWCRIGHFRASPEVRTAAVTRIIGCLTVIQTIGRTLSPRVQDLLYEEIVDAFLTAMAHPVTVNGAPCPTRNGARIVKLVEDYAMAFRADSVQIRDLCRELGLSRRTLDRVFQEHLGMGPKTYLRLARLSAVRARLSETAPVETSITNVALDYGFFELGRFSVQYRQMFGETPTQTLRRRKSNQLRADEVLDWPLRSKRLPKGSLHESDQIVWDVGTGQEREPSR